MDIVVFFPFAALWLLSIQLGHLLMMSLKQLTWEFGEMLIFFNILNAWSQHKVALWSSAMDLYKICTVLCFLIVDTSWQSDYPQGLLVNYCTWWLAIVLAVSRLNRYKNWWCNIVKSTFTTTSSVWDFLSVSANVCVVRTVCDCSTIWISV